MRIFYLDESNYMEYQKGPLAIGGIICSKENEEEHKQRIREIKNKYGFKGRFEIKWTKVSEKTVDLYKELIDYIFNDNDFKVRILIADKIKNRRLSYIDWYTRLHHGLFQNCPFEINGVISDMKGIGAEVKLDYTTEISLRGNMQKRNIYMKSCENSLIQLADLIIGITVAYNKTDITSKSKIQLVNHIKQYMPLGQSTSIKFPNDKYNIFYMRPKNV